MLYEEPPPKGPAGCLDALVVLRAVAGLLFWPLAALVAAAILVFAAVALFAVQPALALLPLAVAVLAVVLYARWERRHFRPPGI